MVTIRRNILVDKSKFGKFYMHYESKKKKKKNYMWRPGKGKELRIAKEGNQFIGEFLEAVKKSLKKTM